MRKRITFSPVTRLSGLLSVEIVLDNNIIVDARAKSTMFRGYEYIMQGRKVTDAVYMTERVCGICSLAHGAVSSYLLDELYDNEIPENSQYLRNIMFAADFLQNHIRHFYIFSLPDFVKMPEKPPFLGQNLVDARLNYNDNKRMIEHYAKAIKAAQESHQLLALFGGKIPNQHSFIHGGVTVAPTVDKINSAKSLIDNIYEFVCYCMIPDTKLISRIYDDYYHIGVTPRRVISFGLFRFGSKNEKYLWPPGVIDLDKFTEPDINLIEETVDYSYFSINKEQKNEGDAEVVEPDPFKPGAYSWTKTVQYDGLHFETGPLARAIICGEYWGTPSTMARIFARSFETLKLAELIREWLDKLEPGPPPLNQKEEPVKNKVVATTDAMRGALLHRAIVKDDRVKKYDIITPTTWNFSPRDQFGNSGPVEKALIGTVIPDKEMLYTVIGRIIRSFDPCISCATHVYDADGNLKDKIIY